MREGSARHSRGAEAAGAGTVPTRAGGPLGQEQGPLEEEESKKKEILEYHKKEMGFHHPNLEVPAFKKKGAN